MKLKIGDNEIDGVTISGKVGKLRSMNDLNSCSLLATGSTDAYAKGTKVTYNGKHYISLIDSNVWSPDAYPTGWKEEE